MTLLVYVDELASEHESPGHPERQERIEACLTAFESSGVEAEIRQPKEASQEQLERAHSPALVDRLRRICEHGGGQLDPDTYARPASFRVAARSAGACCAAVDDAFAGRRSFCLVRPPGHHATARRAMGFCLLNHVAVAARDALASSLAQKVAILDIDVHHGNGTQDIFWDDPAVLYASLHQYPWYPGTGALEENGGEGARGSVINVPLPAGTGDDSYLAATKRIIEPAVVEFSPDVLIVSAGFDAHVRDPLGLMEVTTEGFESLASLLISLAQTTCEGRVVFALEGGYDLEGLSSSFLATLHAMREPRDAHVPEDLMQQGPPRSVTALQRAAEFHALH